MDRPRWGYLLVTQPADVCWNGSPCPNFDTTEMVPWAAIERRTLPADRLSRHPTDHPPEGTR